MTNDPELQKKLALYRSHGITREPEQMHKAADGPWYYEQVALGYNYRMTDVQAAIGISQMARLDDFIETRKSIVSRYNELLADCPFHLPTVATNRDSAWHLYIIRLNAEIESRHKEIFQALQANGIGVQLHYIPIHTQPYYQGITDNEDSLGNAMQYYRTAISLPIYTQLSSEDIEEVVHRIKEIV